jgi:hypothetical protein
MLHPPSSHTSVLAARARAGSLCARGLRPGVDIARRYPSERRMGAAATGVGRFAAATPAFQAV